MLSLIYGTNQVAIRNYILRSAKEVKACSIREYNLASDPISAIEPTLQEDIFGEITLNVIDITKAAKVQIDILLKTVYQYPNAQIILFSIRDLESTNPILKALRAIKGKVVSATVARKSDVFRYLDDLFSKRVDACYVSLRKLLESDNDPVYILVMLQYQLRNVALAKFGLAGKLSPFQSASAIKQAQNFSQNEILDIYQMLFEYDAKLKMGRIQSDVLPALCTHKILGRM